jgi:hypothetical protein
MRVWIRNGVATAKHGVMAIWRIARSGTIYGVLIPFSYFVASWRSLWFNIDFAVPY